MSLYVLKFGGSSVATTARIKHVAEIVGSFLRKGERVVVVTSAMQGDTNSLIDLTRAFSESSFNREYDAVISAGEQVAAGLLSMALNASGINAQSMNAWQVPIDASGSHSDAHITGVNKEKILEMVNAGIVPIITGFQGISQDGDIYTLGRGGSDATACAIAKTICSDECLIYTDVDGVYTADPRIVLDAQRIDEISYDEMLDLSAWGAKVLQRKSVQIAEEYGINLRVLSSFAENTGTKISKETQYILGNSVAGIAHSLDYFALKIKGWEEANSLIKNYVEHSWRQENAKVGNFLIAKIYQKEVENLLNENKIESEMDSDIGVVTVVGDFGSFKCSCDSITFKDLEKMPKADMEESVNRNEVINKIHSVISENEIDFKEMVIGHHSISAMIPFQQTVLLVNKLHEKCVNRKLK